MEGEPPERDPFEHWTLDENFVDGASFQEATARERARASVQENRRRREADRHTEQWQKKQDRKQRRTNRHTAADSDWSSTYGTSGSSTRRKPPWRGIFAVVIIAGLLGWNAFARNGSTAGTASFGRTADAFNLEGVVTDFPNPSSESQTEPLGQPASPPSEQGTYTFIGTQSGGSRPVAYDPCRPIHVVVNDRTMPVGGDALLQQALDDVSAATGLQFVIDGMTDEEPTEQRAPIDKTRYGDRWAPVLVSWTDPLLRPDLDGDVAGFGGSQSISKGSGDTVYVTGTVALDGPQFGDISRLGNGQAIAVGIIRHELGHLVGLDHVQDTDELMYPQTTESNTNFGPGDLSGLSLLGQGACRSDL